MCLIVAPPLVRSSLVRAGIHSQQDLHDFIREAELMKSFDHENVVRLLGETPAWPGLRGGANVPDILVVPVLALKLNEYKNTIKIIKFTQEYTILCFII